MKRRRGALMVRRGEIVRESIAKSVLGLAIDLEQSDVIGTQDVGAV